MGSVEDKDMEIGVMAEPNWAVKLFQPEKTREYETWLVAEMDRTTLRAEKTKTREDTDKAWMAITRAELYLKKN